MNRIHRPLVPGAERLEIPSGMMPMLLSGELVLCAIQPTAIHAYPKPPAGTEFRTRPCVLLTTSITLWRRDDDGDWYAYATMQATWERGLYYAWEAVPFRTVVYVGGSGSVVHIAAHAQAYKDCWTLFAIFLSSLGDQERHEYFVNGPKPKEESDDNPVVH